MSSANQHLKDVIEGRAPLPTAQTESIKEATSTSLGFGVQSSGPVDETEAKNTKRVSPEELRRGPENVNVDAEQLATLAEGDVADAVDRKSGTQKVPGQTIVEDNYVGDLERLAYPHEPPTLSISNHARLTQCFSPGQEETGASRRAAGDQGAEEIWAGH